MIISHGDENLDVNELGMIAAIDGSQNGDIKTTKWAHSGDQFGFSSPIIDGNRVYQIDNGSQAQGLRPREGHAAVDADARHGAEGAAGVRRRQAVRRHRKRQVLHRPAARRIEAEILSEVELPISTDENAGQSAGVPEPVFGGAAISRGRIFFASTGGVYAIGPKAAKPPTGFAVDEPAVPGEGAAAWVQVSPTELVLKPGQAVKLHARAVRRAGALPARGDRRHLGADRTEGRGRRRRHVHAGRRHAGAGGHDQSDSSARSPVKPARAWSRPLPWTETFDGYRRRRGPARMDLVDHRRRWRSARWTGRRSLVKGADETIFKRFRAFVGPVDMANYTVEADVRGATRRRQMADMGVTAQRYSLVHLRQRPGDEDRAVGAGDGALGRRSPFEWKADTWYHLKLRVENMPDGKVRARGKAWPTGQPEPANWMIEKIDPIGNRKGAPGFFIDAEFGAYIDNIKVTANQ